MSRPLKTIYIISSLIVIVNSRSVNIPAVCRLEAESGPCYGSHSRYFFNGQSGECEQFSYGGCQGNGNNFLTLEHCQSMCTPLAPLKRSSRQVTVAVQSSNETLLSDSQQSQNETVTTTSTPEPIVTTIKPNNVETEAPTPPKTREDVCFQPFAEGNCKENLIRYYYDPEVNKCKKFIFKGCFQYDNNFEKLEDCESLCVLVNPTTPPTTS